MGERMIVRSADRTHVPDLEPNAENQRPKTRDHRDAKLYRYEGSDLYQWFSKRGQSVFSDPFGEPFVMDGAQMAEPAPKPPSDHLVICIPGEDSGLEVTVDAFTNAMAAQDAFFEMKDRGWYADVLTIYRHPLKDGSMGTWWGGMWTGYGRRNGAATREDSEPQPRAPLADGDRSRDEQKQHLPQTTIPSGGGDD